MMLHVNTYFHHVHAPFSLKTAINLKTTSNGRPNYSPAQLYKSPQYNISSSFIYSVVISKVVLHHALLPMPSLPSKHDCLLTLRHNHTPHSLLTAQTHYTIATRDTLNTLLDILIHIVSYYYDDISHTSTFSINYVILKIQSNINRVGAFSLIAKLGRKYTKCSVVIINHPLDETKSTFTSTAWSYDHNALKTCSIHTQLQSLHHTELHDNTTPDNDLHDEYNTSQTIPQEFDLGYSTEYHTNYLMSPIPSPPTYPLPPQTHYGKLTQGSTQRDALNCNLS